MVCISGAILKDNEGFTWIGTNSDGLFKYNSIDFKSYKQELNSNKASLNSSIVYSTFQDSNYNIWVGTELGLNLYNKDLDKFENIQLLKDQKKINIPVHAITEYDENTLLFGTHEHGLYKLDKKTLSSKLIKYKDKTNYRTLSLPRAINEHTDMQAASPPYEINKLYSLIGVGTDAIRWLAILIAFVSAISIFISLYKSMKERKYELSLIRVMGGSRAILFMLIVIELNHNIKCFFEKNKIFRRKF